MSDVLMLHHFIYAPGSGGNCRFAYIAKLLAQKGHNIEFVTTTFSHGSKKQRNIKKEIIDALPYKFTMIDEPGYKSNVSVGRILSHRQLGNNLSKYLEKRKKPDIIYCSVPSLSFAYAAARYAKENSIKFIIDVQDIWPEAFRLFFNIPLISDLVFLPMKKQADYIYGVADGVVAVSDTYVNRALASNDKVKKGLSVFLGTELKMFDEAAEKEQFAREDSDFWITYIGSLSSNYDIKCVIDAIKKIEDNGIHNCIFKVLGDGPSKMDFERYAKEKGIKADFTGDLPYAKMAAYLKASDIVVNPITNSASSIINKVGDYAACGKPVINTQPSDEYRKLVDEYKCGINVGVSDSKGLADAIIKLKNNEELRKQMGMNNRRLAEEKFDRAETYPKIVKLIEGLL